MKITRTITPTGDWWEYEDATRKDFEMTITSPTQGREDDKAPRFQGIITIVPKQATIDAILIVVDDFDTLKDLLRYTPYAIPSYSRDQTLGRLSSAVFERFFSETVPLRGVRKKETRDARIRETRDRVAARLKKNGSDIADVWDDFLESFNGGICRQVNQCNEHTETRLKGALKSNESWTEYVDKNGGGFTNIKEDIEELEGKVEALERYLDERYSELQRCRAKTWIDVNESHGWEWHPRSKNSVVKLPDEYVELNKRFVEDGKAFVCRPKHRRGLFTYDGD